MVDDGICAYDVCPRSVQPEEANGQESKKLIPALKRHVQTVELVQVF